MSEHSDSYLYPDKSPLVSIVIPLYNGEQFIRDAVTSCLSQNYPAIEIVIVNDGSSDNSLQTATSIAQQHPHVHLLSHNSNMGVSVAWNTGMKAANGAFVLRLAQDDRLEPEGVSSLVATAQQHPNADVFYADETRIRKGAAPLLRHTAPPDELFRSGNNLGLCVMISRRVLDAGFRYNPDIRAAEDLDFFVRIYDHGLHFAKYEGAPLLIVNLHDASSSAKRYARQQIEVARILAPRAKRLIDRWKLNGRYYSVAVYHLRRTGKRAEAATLIQCGLARSPFYLELWRQLLAIALNRKPRD